MAPRKKTTNTGYRNKLSNVQFHTVCEYLSAHESTLSGRTPEAIADRIDADLSITVTPANLKQAQAALSAAKGEPVTWVVPPKRGAKAEASGQTDAAVPADVAQQIDELNRAVRALAYGLTSLHEAWDVRVPASLKKLTRGTKQQ